MALRETVRRMDKEGLRPFGLMVCFEKGRPSWVAHRMFSDDADDDAW